MNTNNTTGCQPVWKLQWKILTSLSSGASNPSQWMFCVQI